MYTKDYAETFNWAAMKVVWKKTFILETFFTPLTVSKLLKSRVDTRIRQKAGYKING